MFAMRRMSGGGGSGGANPFNVGKSKAKYMKRETRPTELHLRM